MPTKKNSAGEQQPYDSEGKYTSSNASDRYSQVNKALEKGYTRNEIKNMSTKDLRISNLKNELENAKGIFAKAKIKEQINMLEDGFDDIDKYRAYKEEQRQKAINEADKKASIEKEERKKKQEMREQEEKEAELYRNYKFDNKSSAEKIGILFDLSNKYTADDFIPLYHGGDKKSVSDLQDNVDIYSVNEKEEKFGNLSGGNLFGLSTSKNEAGAKIFSKSRGNDNVATIYLSPDAKVYDLGKKHIDDLSEKDVYNIMKQGYDVIDTSFNNEEKEMRVLNSSKVFTTKQMKKVF